MASLTLVVGAINASVVASNANASSVLLEYADAIGADGTAQEKAEAVVRALVRHMAEEGGEYKRRTAAAAARYAPENQVGAWE